MRREEAVVHDEVDRGAGDEGRELFQKLDGLGEELRGAIAPGSVFRPPGGAYRSFSMPNSGRTSQPQDREPAVDSPKDMLDAYVARFTVYEYLAGRDLLPAGHRR